MVLPLFIKHYTHSSYIDYVCLYSLILLMLIVPMNVINSMC